MDWDELVSIGRVARPQGRRGEVVINPMTDFPERFDELERVFLREDEGEVQELRLEASRQHLGRPVLKFEGISDISGAEQLSGKELRIPESELRPLPEGTYYHFQVVGCEVWDRDSGYLGRVENVMSTGGTDVLVVCGDAGELLIPLCADICRRIAPEERRIDIEAPDGLISINAN